MSLIPENNVLFSLENSFHVTAVGLIVTGSPTFEQWANVGKTFAAVAGASQWVLGDWINDGDQRWGEKYAQALDETDYELQTLQDIAWVCRSWPMERRRMPPVTFTHHRHLAGLEEIEQEEWMHRVIQEKWSASKLWHELHKTNGEQITHYSGKAIVRSETNSNLIEIELPYPLSDLPVNSEVEIRIYSYKPTDE